MRKGERPRVNMVEGICTLQQKGQNSVQTKRAAKRAKKAVNGNGCPLVAA